MKMANNLIEQCQGFLPSTLCNFLLVCLEKNQKRYGHFDYVRLFLDSVLSLPQGS